MSILVQFQSWDGILAPGTELFKKFFPFIFFPFFRFYFFLERVEGSEKERERNIDVQEVNRLAASCTPHTRDLVSNSGMRPNWESNWQPFSSLVSTQIH